ncbi:hypothetical protein [Moraxella oculi]|uniref:Antitoxin VbhA domain-containing protein n=1 Tax=Moraxella oculi TaxID=2940516 RepID=A0ABW8U5Y8_9GAMM
MSAVLTHDFDLELTRQELAKQAKQTTFESVGLEALRRYKATGLHITDEELQAYIGSLANGEFVEFPKFIGNASLVSAMR